MQLTVNGDNVVGESSTSVDELYPVMGYFEASAADGKHLYSISVQRVSPEDGTYEQTKVALGSPHVMNDYIKSVKLYAPDVSTGAGSFVELWGIDA